MQDSIVSPILNQSLIDELAVPDEEFSESTLKAIMERPGVVPDLIAILKDEELSDEDGPGGGWAPINACSVLKELEATESIETMIEVLKSLDTADILYSKIIFALSSFGAPVVEPTLEAYSKSESDDLRTCFAEILSRCNVTDARIFPVLLESLSKEPILGACNLAEYGDPAAIPFLSKALDNCKLNHNPTYWEKATVMELAYAIEQLGGTLTERQSVLYKKSMNKERDTAKPSIYSLGKPGQSVKLY